MQNLTAISSSARRVVSTTRLLLVLSVLLLSLPAFAQQEYVGRYDAYLGYMFLDSPHINLIEHGVHTQVGMRATRWLSLGFDFSVGTGTSTITPDMLLPSLQEQLGAQLEQLIAAGIIPPTYVLKVPFDSQTETYAAGPQIAYRHFKNVTLFIRPDLGGMHARAWTHPQDPIAKAMVAQLNPTGEKSDWVVFYGFGGGVDWMFTKRFGLRIQADFVHDHLFSDLLKDSRNTVRFSVGPTVQWGRNVGK